MSGIFCQAYNGAVADRRYGRAVLNILGALLHLGVLLRFVARGRKDRFTAKPGAPARK
jgi:hypothetical protein